MAGRTPVVVPVLRYRDTRAALDFLTRAFGLTTLVAYEEDDGTVAHAELRHGDGVIMIGPARDEGIRAAGPSLVYLAVADPDTHHAAAVEAGAEIMQPPKDMDYGSREYTARDPEGHIWSFGTYVPTL